ncbi:PAS domain-containing protein [Desulfovibrio sp. OttesenSCG-928-C06]|nr:PAS domain-containing protein [Desulfovibrio sp. OttesenSCG-928-C06]
MQPNYGRAIPPRSFIKRARAFFDLFPRIKGHAAWLWHVPSSTVEFSDEWLEILGHPEENAMLTDVGLWFPEMVHIDDQREFLEESRKIVEGQTEEYQAHLRVRNGDSWAWLTSRGKVTEKQDGKPLYVSGIITDVTTLRTDMNFQHIDSPVNKLDKAMLSSKQALELPQELVAFLKKNVNYVFETGEVIKEQVALSAPDGQKVLGEYSFCPEFGADGEVVATMTQFRDISDRILAGRAAYLNEIRLNALYRLTRMDNAPVEELLRFVMANLLTITGSESGMLFFVPEKPGSKGTVVWSENLQKTFGEALPTTSTATELARLLDVHQRISGSHIRNGNCLQPVCMPFDGTMSVLRYISAPVLEDGRIICIASVANKEAEYTKSDLQQLEAFISGAWFILRRHAYVKSLKLAKEKAEAATTAMSEFIANVNHELRSPLASILVYAETMVEFGMEDAGFRQRAVDVIQSQANKMHRLVLDLLNLSRIDGSIPLQMADLNLDEMLDEVTRDLSVAFQVKNLNLEVSAPPGLQVRADRHFLFQVFRNLLENASRYANEGTTVKVQISQTAKETAVSISDQGPHIPESELERIFERFYRLGQSAKSQLPAGTGVGLSICRNVVERHGGRIWAENTEDGVVFRFTLPIKPS